MKLLLIGNPNVGKSAIFTHLTGVSVVTSNYPGSTVSYTKGYLTVYRNNDKNAEGLCRYQAGAHKIKRRRRGIKKSAEIESMKNGCGSGCRNCHKGRHYMNTDNTETATVVEVLDVPGTYRLDPDNDAEKVAVKMLEEGDFLVNIVDATNLERNLNLTLQLLQYSKPMILVLNMWDETKHKGISIDPKKLSEILGIPVVCTSGISGIGMDELVKAFIANMDNKREGIDYKNRWEYIGEIVGKVQSLKHRHHTLLEKLQDLSVHPFLGFPFAIISLLMIFSVIIRIGDYLTKFTSLMLEKYYSPLIYLIGDWLGNDGFFYDILLGNINGDVIDFEAAMGVLTTGVFMTLGIVLPYIIVFYIVLGFIEDLGYLPRIAIIFDKLMHNIGLHGFSVIPMMLSFGCNVPGVMALRNLESRRERFITGVVMSVTIPCMAQSAIILHAAGTRGITYVGVILATLVSVWIILGTILKYLVKGHTTTLIMEIPPYRKPGVQIQIKTLLMRVKGFIIEAVPYVLGGILVINVLTVIGAIDIVGGLFKPIIEGVFGLPAETVSTFIIGIVRKDAAVVLLEPLNLTDGQMITAVICLILYFPCIATFVVLLKELGIKDTIKAAAIMGIVTLVTGGIVNVSLNGGISPSVFIIIELTFSVLFSKIMYIINFNRRIEKIGFK